MDDLSFDVRPGVVTGFLGPNGAGKSTTMRLTLDLDHGAGETRFDGRRFRDIRDPMREIGVALEAKAFHPTRTARNHLRMLAAANRIPTSRVDEVFDIVGLTEVKRKKPRGFSMGMAQRLGLAQALLGDPRMLILDEPANGLDPHGIHWLRDVLKSLAGQGRTVFVSSHLLAEMSLMADELVVIGRGKMIDNGPVDGFVKKFTQTTVLVRTPAADTFGDILRREGADLEPLPDEPSWSPVQTRRPSANWLTGRASSYTSWRRRAPRWSRPSCPRPESPRSSSPTSSWQRWHRQTRTLQRPNRALMARVEVAGDRRAAL